MKRFTSLLISIVIFTLIWLGLVINVANNINYEDGLLFKDATTQFKVIYVYGCVLILGYAYLLIPKKIGYHF